MTTVAFAFLLTGPLIFLLSLPLVYRKVPMNHFYGIRIRASFESEPRWYAINAYGGRLLAMGAVPIVGVGVAGLFLPARWLQPYALAALAVTLISLLVPLVLILLWSHARQPGGSDAGVGAGKGQHSR